jgi:hypothetical protein
MTDKKTTAPLSTKVVTGLVRFSYVSVFEPKKMEGDAEAKYSVSLIVPKKDKETVAKIHKAIEAAKEAGKAGKFGGRVPANLKSPLRDGDEERADDEAYAGAWFLTANSKTKPGLVDASLNEILDSNELYSGCYGKASVTFFAFNTNGNKGIACGLNHLQKIKDGEPLGGRGRAADDFEEENEDDYDFLD